MNRRDKNVMKCVRNGKGGRRRLRVEQERCAWEIPLRVIYVTYPTWKHLFLSCSVGCLLASRFVDTTWRGMSLRDPHMEGKVGCYIDISRCADTSQLQSNYSHYWFLVVRRVTLRAHPHKLGPHQGLSLSAAARIFSYAAGTEKCSGVRHGTS
jgi:hypothetical protein